MGGLDRIRPCRLPPLTFMKGRMRVKSTRTAQLKWRMMLVLTTPGLRVLTITPAKPHRQRCAGVWGWGHRDPGTGWAPVPASRVQIPRCHPTWSSSSSPKPSLGAGALLCPGTRATLGDVAIAGQESPTHGEHGGPREYLPGPRPPQPHCAAPVSWRSSMGWLGWADGPGVQPSLGAPWHGTAWDGSAWHGMARDSMAQPSVAQPSTHLCPAGAAPARR